MLIFVDSFAHYAQAQMGEKWDIVSNPYGFNPANPSDTVDLVQSVSSGRFGRGGVTFSAPNRVILDTVGQANDAQYIQKDYNGVSVIHCGLAVRQTGTQVAGTGSGVGTTAGGRLLTFLDGATTQVGIDILPSGQLQAIRSTLPGTGIFLCTSSASFPPQTLTVLGESINAISASSFDFLEFKITHHGTNGIIEVKRNTTEAFWTLSNVNTAVSGVNNSASVLVGGYGAACQANLGALQCHYLRAVVSDFHLLNTTSDGSDALNPTTFIGDRSWEPMPPLADGFYTQWSTQGSASHFANIDEIPPNTTDYNHSSTVGNKDSFDIAAPSGPTTASVLVAVTMYCQKQSGGSVAVKGLMRLAGADRNGTEFQVPSPYGFRQSFLASKPGGGAITIADMGSGELGYERTI